jgi:hypothetical protein
LLGPGHMDFALIGSEDTSQATVYSAAWSEVCGRPPLIRTW